MRRSLLLLPTWVSAATIAALGACGGDDTGPNPTAGDASTADMSSSDIAVADTTHPSDAPADTAQPDAPVADGGSDAPGITVSVLAQFDKSKGQLPEGLWEVSPSAAAFVGNGGTPITAFAPTATPVTVTADGGFTSFGTLAAGAPQSSYTLGVITDAAGNVYYAVAAAAAPPNNPVPGIYKFPAGGGTATPFSVGSAVTPPMNFPNGLDVMGTDLFVADSEGVIYKINSAGVASVWSNDPLLAPSTTACGGQVPLPIGANGIVHDTNNVYVTNTDCGRLIKIPMNPNGSAGTATILKEDCATLVGADGLLIDPKDGSFIIAANILNKIQRVSPDGTQVSTLASGSPLLNPASPILDTAGGKRRLLVTNPGFFASADAGSPNIAQVTLP
jgi:hypothetical protein